MNYICLIMPFPCSAIIVIQKRHVKKRRKKPGGSDTGIRRWLGSGWDPPAECTGRRAKKKATGSGPPVAKMPRPQGPEGPADRDWIEGRRNRRRQRP
jgi:hypothetical protein